MHLSEKAFSGAYSATPERQMDAVAPRSKCTLPETVAVMLCHQPAGTQTRWIDELPLLHNHLKTFFYHLS